MGRRVWIIAKKDQVEQSDIDAALANNCPEIANGIPPALRGIVDEASLPMAYEEPTPPEPEPPLSTHLAKIVAIDPGAVKPATVTRTWKGKEYTYDCFVTESVKDQWQAGDIAVGDYVIVHFDDTGEQIVVAKVFRSW